MKKQSSFLCLVLSLLLAFSTSVQAWVMSPVPTHANTTMMNMDEHCAEQPSSDVQNCQHDHCSMCMIGVLPTTLSLPAPSAASQRPQVTEYHLDRQPNELFRPPKA